MQFIGKIIFICLFSNSLIGCKTRHSRSDLQATPASNSSSDPETFDRLVVIGLDLQANFKTFSTYNRGQVLARQEPLLLITNTLSGQEQWLNSVLKLLDGLDVAFQSSSDAMRIQVTELQAERTAFWQGAEANTNLLRRCMWIDDNKEALQRLFVKHAKVLQQLESWVAAAQEKSGKIFCCFVCSTSEYKGYTFGDWSECSSTYQCGFRATDPKIARGARYSYQDSAERPEQCPKNRSYRLKTDYRWENRSDCGWMDSKSCSDKQAAL